VKKWRLWVIIIFLIASIWERSQILQETKRLERIAEAQAVRLYQIERLLKDGVCE
jgi:hypothetical protein